MKRWISTICLLLGAASAQSAFFELKGPGAALQALSPAEASEAMAQLLDSVHASCQINPRAFRYRMPEEATALVNAYFTSQGYEVSALPRASGPGTSVWQAEAQGKPSLLGFYRQTNVQTGAGVVGACPAMFQIIDGLNNFNGRADTASPTQSVPPGTARTDADQAAAGSTSTSQAAHSSIGRLLWLLLLGGGGLGARLFRTIRPRNPLLGEDIGT